MNKRITAVCIAILIISIAVGYATEYGKPVKTEKDSKSTSASDSEIKKALSEGKTVSPGGTIIDEKEREKRIIKKGKFYKKDTKSIEDINVPEIKNLPKNQTINIACEGNGSCTYEIIQVKASEVPPTVNGYVEEAIMMASAISYSGAKWYVPNKPPWGGHGEVNFLFPGVISSSSTDILQPVLSWGNGGDYSWSMVPWWGIDGVYNHGTPIKVNVGDRIAGSVNLNSAGSYDIGLYDYNTGGWTNSRIYDGKRFTYGLVVLESKNVDYCVQFPGTTTFSEITFQDINKKVYNNPWTAKQMYSGCGLGVTINSQKSVTLKTKN